jgi:BASS family bile acid:Na+ symporter
MTVARLFSLGIGLSIALMVFSIALNAGGRRLDASARQPALLARSLVAMYLVMPFLAVGIALNLELNRPLLIALMLVALAPVPPVLPSKQLKAGGNEAYVLTLLVASAIAAIAVVPAGVELLGRIFGRDLAVPFGVTAKAVAVPVLVPVVAGLALGRIAPGVAERVAGPLSAASSLLLAALFLPVVFTQWPTIVEQAGNFTVVAIVLFIAAGLATGHLLGGPDPDNRTALALATATRHPGVALAVLRAVAPEEEGVQAVILLYLVVGIVASIPYVAWRKRARAAAGAGQGKT